MPRKGRSNEEIVRALHQVDGGEKVTEFCRRLHGNPDGKRRIPETPVSSGCSGTARRALSSTGGRDR
jgi:hypothetical protein